MLSNPARKPALVGRRSLRRHPVLLTVAIATSGFVAAACGGGSTKSATPATSASTAASASSAAGATSASRAKFTACLESHGVPASAASAFGGARRGLRPSGTAGASGSSGAVTGTSTPGAGRPGGGLFSQYSAAFSACRSDLGGFAALNSPQFIAYRNCLTAHGVTTPTGPPSSTPSGSSAGAASNPAVAAARAACAPLLPARSTTTTTTAAG